MLSGTRRMQFSIQERQDAIIRIRSLCKCVASNLILINVAPKLPFVCRAFQLLVFVSVPIVDSNIESLCAFVYILRLLISYSRWQNHSFQNLDFCQIGNGVAEALIHVILR